MASIVLGIADKALFPGDAASDVTHWSYKLFIAGSVVGAVAAVAALIFSMFPIIACGVLLCLTNAAAAFYVKKFSNLNALEDYNKRLADKVSELRDANKDLSKINKRIEEIPGEWREEIENGKKALRKKTEELQLVSDKLKQTEEKLQKLATVSVDIQKKTGELSVEALKFSKDNHLFGERVERLSGEVSQIEEHNQNLVKLILETDKNTDQYEELFKQFQGQVKLLEDLFGLMKELYLNAQERMAGLEKQVDELGAVMPDAINSSRKAELASLQLSHLQEQYAALTGRLEAALEKLKNYNLYKTSHKELQKLKESAEWEEFQAIRRK